MKISEIYKQYKIMPSLQLHMLRVTSIAQIMCDSFNGEIHKNDIITACLLHDMGNILKFNLDLFPEFLEPEGKDYWQRVKNYYEKKYGNDEHSATLAIVRELNLGDRIIELVDSFQFSLAKENYLSQDLDKKICAYADMRVEPHGVVTLEQRLIDGRVRFKMNKKHHKEDSLFFKDMGDHLRKIEKQIFDRTGISPESITEQKVTSYIENLRNFDIAVHKN